MGRAKGVGGGGLCGTWCTWCGYLDLSKDNGPPIAQLPGPVPELVSTVAHSVRVHAFEGVLPGEGAQEFLPLRFGVVEVEEVRALTGDAKEGLLTLGGGWGDAGVGGALDLADDVDLVGVGRELLLERVAVGEVFETARGGGTGVGHNARGRCGGDATQEYGGGSYG